jgi:hypothetical protein
MKEAMMGLMVMVAGAVCYTVCYTVFVVALVVCRKDSDRVACSVPQTGDNAQITVNGETLTADGLATGWHGIVILPNGKYLVTHCPKTNLHNVAVQTRWCNSNCVTNATTEGRM